MALCTVDFYSNIIGCDMTMNVLLPEHRRGETVLWNKKLPVLYLLHGNGDNHQAWIRKSNIELYTRNLDLIVVMASTQRGFYTDTKYGLEYFKFFAEELPVIAQNFFPISEKRENTYVAGNSMGGYGAFKLAMTYPEKYIAAASLSGAMFPYDVVEKKVAEGIMGEKFVKDQQAIFGMSPEEFYKSENNLYTLVEQMRNKDCGQPKLYQCCGTDDKLTYSFNKEFYEKVKQQYPDVNIKYDEGIGGHNWFYWNQQISKILDYFGLC